MERFRKKIVTLCPPDEKVLRKEKKQKEKNKMSTEPCHVTRTKAIGPNLLKSAKSRYLAASACWRIDSQTFYRKF